MNVRMTSQDGQARAFEWDIFLAHASGDTEKAVELFEVLSGWPYRPARVFLDVRTLKLGDDWDVAIPAAQRASKITVVLASRHSQTAYYQREEIAAAISLARQDGQRHRVVP